MITNTGKVVRKEAAHLQLNHHVVKFLNLEKASARVGGLIRFLRVLDHLRNLTVAFPVVMRCSTRPKVRMPPYLGT